MVFLGRKLRGPLLSFLEEAGHKYGIEILKPQYLYPSKPLCLISPHRDFVCVCAPACVGACVVFLQHVWIIVYSV